MTIQQIIAAILQQQQQGGSGGGGAAASVPKSILPAPSGGTPSGSGGSPSLSSLGSAGLSGAGAGALVAKLISLIGGSKTNQIDPNNPSNFIGNPGPLQDAVGNSLGVGEGALAGAQFGPWGALVGAGIGQAEGVAGQFQSGDIGGGIGNLLLGPGLGSFVGDEIAPAGIPREAKTSALGGALTQSPNILDQLIGQYVNRGVNQGQVLSESGPKTFENSVGQLSSFLEALTGQRESSASATGFGNNPTFTPPDLGKVESKFALPTGDQFVNDPNSLAQIAKIIQQTSGLQSGYNAKADWQKVLNQLSSQGLLSKYQGPMGAPGGGLPGTSGIPNVALPHPLTQNTATAQPPYPV